MLPGDYLYWTEWQRRSVERVNKRTGGDRTLIIDQLPDLMGLKATNVKTVTGEWTGLSPDVTGEWTGLSPDVTGEWTGLSPDLHW